MARRSGSQACPSGRTPATRRRQCRWSGQFSRAAAQGNRVREGQACTGGGRGALPLDPARRRCPLDPHQRPSLWNPFFWLRRSGGVAGRHGLPGSRRQPPVRASESHCGRLAKSGVWWLLPVTSRVAGAPDLTVRCRSAPGRAPRSCRMPPLLTATISFPNSLGTHGQGVPSRHQEGRHG